MCYPLLLVDHDELFDQAFEGAGIGMYLADPSLRIRRANRALCKILGYTREELDGRTTSRSKPRATTAQARSLRTLP